VSCPSLYSCAYVRKFDWEFGSAGAKKSRVVLTKEKVKIVSARRG
jgi:hypothetical protein